MICD